MYIKVHHQNYTWYCKWEIFKHCEVPTGAFNKNSNIKSAIEKRQEDTFRTSNEKSLLVKLFVAECEITNT